MTMTRQSMTSRELLRKQIIEDNASGIGVKKLCRQYKIGKSTVYRWLHEGKALPVEELKTISAREIYLLKAENVRLKKHVQILEEGEIMDAIPLKEKCQLIDKMSPKHGIHLLCRTLGVRRSTYYHHLRRPEKTELEKQDEELRPLIKQVFEESKERFGAHKIKVVLKNRGITVGEKHIVRLMKQMNLICKQCRLKYWSSANRQYKYYPNRLKRGFEQNAPNQVWVSDVTYVRINDAFYYVCAILDLFSRKIVECRVGHENSSDLLLEAFAAAYERRGKPQELMLHSDQGANYTSYIFRSYLREIEVIQSFSHPGTPYDNAVNESFFACMKREELSHKFYTAVEDLMKDVEEYTAFYNSLRPHERLGDKTPDQIEAEYWQNVLAIDRPAGLPDAGQNALPSPLAKTIK